MRTYNGKWSLHLLRANGGRSVPGSLDPRGFLTTKARVTGVVDGDTLKVRLRAGATVNVGLIGVDSPEIGGSGKRAECGGLDATARMRRLAIRNGTGRIVTLRTDPSRDRQARSDRLPAYVDAHGVDVGRTMIASGLAKVHASGSDFARLTTYRDAQASAKAAKRGMWRGCGGT